MSNHFRLPNTYLQTCRKALRPVMQAVNGNTIPLLTSDMYRDFPTNPGLLHDFTAGNNGGPDRVATYGFHAYPVSFGAKNSGSQTSAHVGFGADL